MSPIKLVLVGREKDGIANEAREREEEKRRNEEPRQETNKPKENHERKQKNKMKNATVVCSTVQQSEKRENETRGEPV